MRVAALGVLGLLACGPDPHLHAQTKTVTAHASPADVMVMLDTSSAMGSHIDEVRSALTLMMSATASDIAWGLSTFPAATHSTCGDAAADPRLFPATLSDAHPYLASHTSDVIAQLGSLQTGGDRTVAAAIAGTHFGSPERNDVILLITSGDDACSASLVDAVRARRAEQIQTVVVGFGPSATDLDAAAVAGGFAHTCPMGTDAECGPNGTCQASGVCDHAAYVARDQAELTDALMSLTSMPTGTDTLCSYTLETTAANADRIQVYVGGQQLQQGIDTWSFSPTAVPQTVIFQGATCDKLRESTSMSPVQLEVVVDDRP